MHLFYLFNCHNLFINADRQLTALARSLDRIESNRSIDRPARWLKAAAKKKTVNRKQIATAYNLQTQKSPFTPHKKWRKNKL